MLWHTLLHQNGKEGSTNTESQSRGEGRSQARSTRRLATETESQQATRRTQSQRIPWAIQPKLFRHVITSGAPTWALSLRWRRSCDDTTIQGLGQSSLHRSSCMGSDKIRGQGCRNYSPFLWPILRHSCARRSYVDSFVVMIDHPSELLPFPEGIALNGLSHGMDGCDVSTELFSLSDELTLNAQAYGNDICDVSTGFLSSVGDVATNDQFYCTSIYEGFSGEFFDLCQIDPSLEFSVHEPPFICDKDMDSQSLNEWALRSYGNKIGCVPATADIASAISHSYQDVTVDPSMIFR